MFASRKNAHLILDVKISCILFYSIVYTKQMEKDWVMTVEEGCRVDVIGYQNFFPHEFFIHSVWTLSFFRDRILFSDRTNTEKNSKVLKDIQRCIGKRIGNGQNQLVFKPEYYSAPVNIQYFSFVTIKENTNAYTGHEFNWTWKGKVHLFFLIAIKIHADIRFEVVKSLSA